MKTSIGEILMLQVQLANDLGRNTDKLEVAFVVGNGTRLNFLGNEVSRKSQRVKLAEIYVWLLARQIGKITKPQSHFDSRDWLPFLVDDRTFYFFSDAELQI